MKSKVLIIISVLSGFLFLISGFSKLFPAEVFELTLVNSGITNWDYSPYLARIIIAIELFFGAALLQRHYLKKIFIPGAVVMLLVFSIYLVNSLIISGNTGNCGCFGELIPMSPLSALIKNILMIGLFIYLYNGLEQEKDNKLMTPALMLFGSVIAVMILSPIENVQSDELTGREKTLPRINNSHQDSLPVLPPGQTTIGEVPQKDSVISKETDKKVIEESKEKEEITKQLPKVVSPFAEFHYFSDSAYVDLDSGIKIVALLSLDCEHCMAAAGDMVKLKKEIKLPPVYFLFLGEPNQLEEFYSVSNAQIFPYKMINARTFFPLIKSSPPRVVILNNGNITADFDQESFTKEGLKQKVKSVKK